MKKNHDFGHCMSNAWIKTLRVMKLTAILFFLAIFTVSAEGYSQGTRVSMKMEDASLKEVFRELKSLSDYTFVYSEGMVADVKIAEINLKNVSVEDALTSCLEGTDLEYYIENNVVVIRKKAPVYEQPVEQEKKKIKGKVSDDQGVPLPGVSVVIKGTSVGVATDIDGNYAIEVENGNAVLVFSFVGMMPQEIAYNGQSTLNVTLSADTEQMAEVVVTGYQTLSKERVTGSFHQIKNEDLNKTVNTNLISKIEGAMPGIQVKDNKITIRGVSRINGDTNPLIVIDGFPTEVALSDINSNDIASITVLKDAAAASIWGVKAGNGVIVITTKGGKSEKPTFNASYSYTLGLLPDINKKKMLNTKQYVDLEKESVEKGFWDPIYVDWGYGTNGLQEAYYQFSKDKDQGKLDHTLQELSKVNAQKELEKLFLQNQKQHMFDIGVSGKTDFINYYSSVQLQDNQSFSKGVKDKSINFFNKNVFKITDKLNIGTNITVNYRTSEGSGIGQELISRANPYERIYDDQGNIIRYYLQTHHSIAKPMEEKGFLPMSYSIVDDVNYTDNDANTLMARASINLNYEIFKGLKYSIKYQNEVIKTNSDRLYKLKSAYTKGLINNYLKFDEFGNPIYNIPYGDIMETTNSTVKNWSIRNQLDFDREFGRFQISGIIGSEVRKYTVERDFNRWFGYDTESLNNSYVDYITLTSGSFHTNQLGSSLGSIPKPRRFISDNRDFSNYTNVAVTFDEKYTLTASGRIDQSNLWGISEKFKFNPLWSVGGSWNVSKEEWFESKMLDNLKLRMTYGINGAANKKFYPVLIGYYEQNTINGNNFKNIKLSNPANDNLKWENTKILNLGANFSLLHQRVYGSIDYYSKKSVDLIGSQKVNPSYGWRSITKNYASMTNKGVDISLTFNWLSKGDFSISSSLNLSYNKNEVTKVDSDFSSNLNYLNGASTFSGVPMKGYGMGRIFSYEYAGLNENGEILIWGPNKSGTGVKEKYNAFEDKEVIQNNKDFLSYEGESIAPYYGGFNTDFRYKGFNLRLDFVYNFGGVMRMPVGTIYDFRSGNVTNTIDKRWRKAGDEKHTNVPAIKDFYSHYYYNYDLFYTAADINVENSDYIKLRNIILDYDLPKKLVRKLRLNSLSLKFQASNLWYWAGNSRNIDPEKVDPEAIFQSRINLPDSKTFIFGIKTSF